jgi:NADH-quinone oxidoreductase subunit I
MGQNGEKNYRCTSCGICAKVCPPQCIWIYRANDPNTGRPVPAPADFFVDVDICMNCGMCAEYCPFDAIKMDHDFEIATYDRIANNIYNKEKLGKSAEYYASIRPTNFAREEAAKAEKEAAKAAKKTAG